MVHTDPTSRPETMPARGGLGSGLGRLLWHWLPPVLWMGVIFGLSTNAGAPRNTSRIIGPLLRWIYPAISDPAVTSVLLVTRKSAHVTEYAVLAVLLWRARRRPVPGDRQPWRWKEAMFALGVAVLFAASDEWHQSFVPSRGKSIDEQYNDKAVYYQPQGQVWVVTCYICEQPLHLLYNPNLLKYSNCQGFSHSGHTDEKNKV